MKQQYKGKKKGYVEPVQKKWNWRLLPLQLILSVLPLILYVQIDYSGYSKYAWNSHGDMYLDVFLQGKMVAFIALAAVLLVLLVYKIAKMDKWLRKESLLRFAPILVYLFFVLLSTVCSDDISYSLYGSMDAKESALALAGYVIAVFYVFLAVDSAKDLMQLVGAAVVGAFCMAVVGVLQAVGNDPLLWEGIQKLFAGELIRNGGSLSAAFPSGMAYGTLYNPNYVGTYVALYAPLVLIGIMAYKQLWKKLVCGCTFVGLMIMLFASQSRTGLIAVIAVAVMAIIFLSRSIWRYWYLLIPGITFVVMVFSLIDVSRDNLLTNRLKAMFVIEKSEHPVQGVDTTGNGVRVLYKDTEYTVAMVIEDSDFAYEVKEGNQPLEVKYNEDKSFGYFTLSTGDEIAIQTAQYEQFASCFGFGLVINNRNFYFTNQFISGNYKYINEWGRLDECIIPANVFPGYEGVASGRGYVWGRTIPMLLSNFFVGSGPDTFAITFPQNDYVARYKGGFDNIIFTRPHNFYLQMGIHTGTLSLIAFLVFYIIYFVGSCRKYFFGKMSSAEEWVGLALFLSTVGFMASGLANDSLIVVTPTFYVLLGLGMAINHKLCPVIKKEKKSEKTAEEKNEEEGLK